MALHQARVAADLAQLQKRVEDGDLRAVKTLALQHALHLRIRRDTHAFIQLTLLAKQLHATDDLGLGRQLAGHVGLAPAHDERPHARGQQLGAQRLAIGFDRLTPDAHEAARIAQKARHQPVEVRPQLAEMVFQRRAGDAQAVARIQAAQRAGGAAAGVLHHLRFVQDQEVPGLGFECVQVTPHQRVGGEDDVVLAHAREVALALAALQRQHTQFGCMVGRLVLPVSNERRGQHHQRRAVQAAALFFDEQMGQHLRGFAQAHVVGEDARQVVCTQVLQPGHALLLVAAQRQLQPGGHGHRGRRAGRLQALRQVGQAGAALQLPLAMRAGARGLRFHQADAQRFDAVRFPVRQTQRAFFAPRIGQQVEHGANDGLERCGGCFDAAAARRAQGDDVVVVDVRNLRRLQPAWVALEQVGHQRRQVQRFAVDVHTQAEHEAALCARAAQRLQLRGAFTQWVDELAAELLARVGVDHEAPAVDGDALVRKARLHHDEPALGLQLGHLLGPEVAEVRLFGQ